MKQYYKAIFEDINYILLELNFQDYNQNLSILSNNSIGNHIRHIIELFECLIESKENGILNYDNRKRCPKTENDKEFALEKLQKIESEIEKLDLNKTILLQQNIDGKLIKCETNFQRELLYNIEHSVHHLAIIRIGIEEDFPYIEIPENFGVAHSTIQFREKSEA
jgi:hypothetical protein